METRDTDSLGESLLSEKEKAEASSAKDSTGQNKLGSLLSRLRKSDSAAAEPSKEKIGKEIAEDDEAKIVTARGTEDGLVLRIDGKATWESIVGELDAFLGSRRRFLEGGEVSIEWLERLPTAEQSFELEKYLREGFGVEVVSRRRRPAFTTIVDRSVSRSLDREARLADREGAGGKIVGSIKADRLEEDPLESRLEMDHYNTAKEYTKESSKDERVERVLRDTIEILEDPSGPSYLRRVSKLLGEDLVYEEDANAKIVFGTFRSGQRLETPYSLVVIGDVNPGADLVAGGDIFVLGALRGTAHAAAYDDEAHDRVIIALQMQPVQLRIGSILSRGNDDAARGTEIARVESRRIIVEGFNSRAQLRRKSSASV